MVLTDFSRFFREKYIVRHVMEARESWMACFSCRSLLLSTTVLNDISAAAQHWAHANISNHFLVSAEVTYVTDKIVDCYRYFTYIATT